MRRRDFIKVIAGSATSWPLEARAQQPERMRRVGILMPLTVDDPYDQTRLAAFLQGLGGAGWNVGQNLRIDTRWGGDVERIRRSAMELVALTPDVILSIGTNAAVALQQATRTVPVVFTAVTDPAGAGLVESLAQPGGNMTGFTFFGFGTSAKWLELLKEIAPRVTRAAILRDTSPSGIGSYGAIQGVAPSLGVDTSPIGAQSANEIERAITTFAHSSNGGLIVVTNATTIVNRQLIISLAAKLHLPAVYGYPLFVTTVVSSATDRTASMSAAAPQVMPIASSGARSQRTFRCRSQQSTSLSSTGRPPNLSTSTCPRRSSPVPTR